MTKNLKMKFNEHSLVEGVNEGVNEGVTEPVKKGLVGILNLFVWMVKGVKGDSNSSDIVWQIGLVFPYVYFSAWRDFWIF